MIADHSAVLPAGSVYVLYLQNHTEQLQNHLYADGSVIVLYGSLNTERIQNGLAALTLAWSKILGPKNTFLETNASF